MTSITFPVFVRSESLGPPLIPWEGLEEGVTTRRRGSLRAILEAPHPRRLGAQDLNPGSRTHQCVMMDRRFASRNLKFFIFKMERIVATPSEVVVGAFSDKAHM